MELSVAIISLGFLIFLSHLFNGLFEKTKIPNVLLLLIIGIIVGPIAGWVDASFLGDFGKVFTNIALIIILFESGINLKFAQIKVAIGAAVLLTILNFVGTAVISTFIVIVFTKADMLSSIFMGVVIGGTSSAVVIPMIKQLKLGEKNQTIMLLESALSDVLCLVVGLAVFEGMKAGAIDIGGVFSKMGISFLFAAILGLGMGMVWSILLNMVRSLQNSMFITLALVFVMYGLADLLGLNGGIAVLSFGVLVGNNSFFNNSKLFKKIFSVDTVTFDDQEKRFYSEIVFVIQTYFFVYIGLSIQFDVSYLGFYAIGLVLVVSIILFRPFGIKMVARKNTEIKEVAIMSVLSPKGLVTAVMASLPLQAGLASGKIISNIGYAIVLFSILICSILVILVSKDPLVFTKVYGSKEEKNKMNRGEAPTNEKTSDEKIDPIT